MIEGYLNKQLERTKELTYLAWHIELFSRQKRLPKLEKILKDLNKKKKGLSKRVSKEQLIEIAKRKGLEGPW